MGDLAHVVRRSACKVLHVGERRQELVRVGRLAIWRCPTCQHVYHAQVIS